MSYLPVKFVNFLKSRLILIHSIASECLQINFSHNSRVYISKIKRCFNGKSSKYYFYMKTKILADFQICSSVPLIRTINQLRAQSRKAAILLSIRKKLTQEKLSQK